MIIDALELNNDSAKAPFRLKIERQMRAAFRAESSLGPDATDEAKHVRELRAGAALEIAARRVGFIIGFDYAMRLRFEEGGAR
jgi:hypothetical protein